MKKRLQITLGCQQKNFFFTYSRVHKDITLPRFLEALKTKPQLQSAEILLCKESHEDTNNIDNIHFHGLATRNPKFNIPQAASLSVTLDGRTYPGHYDTNYTDV